MPDVSDPSASGAASTVPTSGASSNGTPAPTYPPSTVTTRGHAAVGATGGRLQRIQHESTELVQDVKDWVELRIDLVRAEVQESIRAQVDGRKATILALVVPGIVGALGALFLLVTLALFLGWWLGHAAWGFLIVTALLLVVAGIARAVLGGKAKAVAKTT